MRLYLKPYLSSIVLALMVLSNCPLLNGQQVIWANKNNLEKRTDFTKVLGQNKNGVYILKHRNSNFRRYFILEHFDKRMNLLKSKTFKIPGAELEKIILNNDNIVYYTKVASKGFSYKLNMYMIDSSFNETFLSEIVKSEAFDHQNVSFNVEYNKFKTKFLVWYIIEAGENTKLFYHLCDNKGKISEGNVTLYFKTNELFINETMLDENNVFYFIHTNTAKFRSKNSEDFKHYFTALRLSDNKMVSELINNKETYISSFKINYNELSSAVHVFGLYGSRDEEENTGYFNINFDSKKFEISNSIFEKFDRKFVSSIIGIKSEQKGDDLSKFKMKKIIPKTDSGFLVILERVFVTTQSDVFYVNGVPQSSYARVYNNDEVILLSLNQNGLIQWQDFIQKNQSSVNDNGYYNGIIIMVNDDKINIMYNDRLNANSDIIQVTYLPDGTHNKKILLNNDQYFALVIPNEYNQVTSNSVVIPVNQNREFTYIKLIY